MKKIIAYLCALVMILTPLQSFAVADVISYGEREKNPALSFPIDEKIIMKGGTIVIEAEDMIANKTMSLIEDELASGEKGMKVAATSWADAESKLGKTPSLMTEIITDSAGTYCIWARVAVASQFSCWYTNDGGIKYKVAYTNSSTSATNYRWERVSTAFNLPEGSTNFSFHYRNTGVKIDKFLITKNTDFAPVGMNDVPEIMQEGETGIYPMPEIVPTEKHPRVYFNAKDIPGLKEKLKSQNLLATYKKIKTSAQDVIDAKLPQDKSNNYNNAILDKIQCRAFMYVLGETDREHAKQTISYLKDYFETVKYANPSVSATYEARSRGYNLWTCGMVYDWCYDVLTDADKEYFIRKSKEFAVDHECGYPPTKRLSISGHGTEDGILRDFLTASIAFYDEEPEFYNLTAGRILSEMKDAIVLYTSASSFQNGNAYGMARYSPAVNAEKLFEAMGANDIFGKEFGDYAYKLMYEKLPLGLWFKDCDDWYWEQNKGFRYNTADTTAYLTAANNGNPYAYRQYIINRSLSSYTGDVVNVLLADGNEAIEPKEIYELPLAFRTTYPFTSMIARTSWQNGYNSPVAMAKMNVRDVNLGDHYHNDVGSFQFWYKGMLALQSGAYQAANSEWGADAHWNYNIRSVAHNTLLVYDPDEKWYNSGGEKSGKLCINDGGQRSQWMRPVNNYEDIVDGTALRAIEKGWYIGPNEMTPSFSYISSDLTPAYTEKISDYDRSMVFLDLFNEDYPAALIVHDRVTSANKDFKKTWLLHSELEPEVKDNVTTIVRNEEGFNGKLVNTTLLPEKNTIEKVGGEGKQFWAGGQNWDIGKTGGTMPDAGNWRIELSPKTASTNDTFLNAMYVTDYDRNLPQLETKKIGNAMMDGVVIYDRAVTFAKSYDRIDAGFSLVIPENGFDKMKMLICDIAEGVWEVSNGKETIYVESTKDNGCLYFEGVPGTYNIKKAAAGITATKFDYPQMPKANVGDFEVYDINKASFVYQPKPVKLIDSLPYIPVEMVTSFGGTYKIDGDKVTITGKGSITFVPGSKEYTNEKGTKGTLKCEPKKIDGTIYIACKDIEGVLKTSTNYDSYGRVAKMREVVDVKTSGKKIGLPDGVVPYEPVMVDCSGHDGSVPENTVDYDFATRWSSEGADEYVLYDLGASKDISKVLISFYQGDKRYLMFEILTSDDAETYTKVFEGRSSGKSTELETFTLNEPVKARYVKILCHGNNLNFWNSLQEVIVTK